MTKKEKKLKKKSEKKSNESIVLENCKLISLSSCKKCKGKNKINLIINNNPIATATINPGTSPGPSPGPGTKFINNILRTCTYFEAIPTPISLSSIGNETKVLINMWGGGGG